APLEVGVHGPDHVQERVRALVPDQVIDDEPIVLDMIRHAELAEPTRELRRQRAQDALEPLGLAPLEPIPGLDDIDRERRARCHLRSLYARWCMTRVIRALDKVFAWPHSPWPHSFTGVVWPPGDGS